MIRTLNELNISQKHKNQLGKARNRHANDFGTKYLAQPIVSFCHGDNDSIPHLFTREDGGFLHFDLENLLNDNRDLDQGFDWSSIHQQSTLFSNPMTLGEYDPSLRVPGKHSGGSPPSQRVSNGGWLVLTYEYDGVTSQDLEMQLDLFSGKPDACAFAAVHKVMSGYADYRGYAAIFSGHKSVHINLIFDIRHLNKDLFGSNERIQTALWTADVPDNTLAALYRRVWAEAASIINTTLGTSFEFDIRLQSYVQKRRSPWGIRTLTKPSTLHSFNAGDQVEQIVVQERLSQRTLAPKGAQAMFTYAKAKPLISYTRQSCSPPSARLVTSDASVDLVPALQSYLTSKGWGTYPMPVDLQFDGTHNILFFKNDAADVHPSTLVRGDHRQLLFGGKGSPSSPVFLPSNLTLDETIDLLSPSLPNPVPMNPDAGTSQSFVPLQYYQNNTVNVDSARDFGGRIMKQIGGSDGVTMLQAPEGLGKTHTLFNTALEQRRDDDAARLQSAQYRGVNPVLQRGFHIIACKTHEQLKGKYREFLRLDDTPKHAVLIKSFSKLYGDAMSAFPGTQELSNTDAGNLGYGSLLQAIQHEQPDIYRRMKRLRDDIWRLPNGKVMFQPDAFVFMVHGLLKVWPHAQHTKAFLHPDFPDNFDPIVIENYAKQMQAYRVIYDEVSWEDIVGIYAEWVVDIAHDAHARCKANADKPWDEAALSERTTAYQSAMQNQNRNPDNLTFEDCDQIIRAKIDDSHKYLVDTTAYPFGKGPKNKNIYAQPHGNAYYCKPKRWFTSLGCPTVILTTEDLPRLIMKSIKAADTSSKISVVNMTNTPHLFKDMVPVKFDESVRFQRKPSKCGQHVPSVVDLARNLLNAGTDFVISKGLAAIPKNLGHKVFSHDGARGRNDMKGKTIATFLTYPTVSEYEIYCILGVAFGIKNPIRVAYRDIVYQDLGRNQGFRYTDGQSSDSHIVYIKSSLFHDLGQLASPHGFDRYQFYLTS